MEEPQLGQNQNGAQSLWLWRRGGSFIYVHTKCGCTQDAADFALVMTVGRMSVRLPTHIPFTVLSGDKEFLEVERQMADSARKMVVIDPQHKN